MPFVTLGPSSHDVLSGVSGADHHADVPAIVTVIDDILVASGNGVLVRRSPASAATMRTGTETTIRGMTALRVAQAISAQHFALATLFSS